ncbi:hypothetical protein N9O19_03060 [Euryarchaeota archaeon]|nr:hypothetical protein [Euryarchaeota archaeon]
MVLKQSVSAVAFKYFCAFIPLKGDLKTQIDFPTGDSKKGGAETVSSVVFRA